MSHVLELRDVSRDYQQGKETIHALKHTNLQIEQGQFVGILGPSGSGKSTLLTIMGGLRAPSTGEVLLDGEAFSSLKEKQRAKLRHSKIGFILQSAGLVPFLTVRDQLAHHDVVARRAPNKERRQQLLESLDIAGYLDSYPADLSGGERQRVAIAAALYHNPALILADEPTAALDSKRAMVVAQILADQTHAQGKATVMVTHDERLLEVCDRTLVMHDGVLTER